MSTDFRREEADGILTLTLTRAEKRNAINHPMWEAIETAVNDLAEDHTLRVLVITGEGSFFTAGTDITTLSPNPGMGDDGVLRGSTARLVYRRGAHHDLFDWMEQVEKPIILAAQNRCLGVGVEMGASCDFRFASDVTTFALPEIPNLSALPASGGMSRLNRLVGPHWTRWLAMAGEEIDAETALRIGFVHAVYPEAEFSERVHAFAAKLVAMPREPLGLAKMAIDHAEQVDRRSARDFDRLAQTLLFQSPDWQARLTAFNERKKS